MEKFLKPVFNKIIRTETEAEQNHNIAKFTVEKLEQGFGNTLGIILRRTILSSIPSLAPFAVEIPGVSHEFQPVEETKEDMVEIVLNISNLILEADETIINLDEVYELKIIKASGTVTANDIEVPTGLKVINKDLIIAQVISGKKLSVLIYVAYSKGYRTFQENRLFVKSNSKVSGKPNIIAIDSKFSPIEKVTYQVNEVNPGESKVYERLILEITTRGNILPEKVVAYAGSILTNYFQVFNDMHIVNLDEQFIEEVEETKDDHQLSFSIETLNLSVRSENALKAAGVKTIEELIDRPISSLQTIKNLGEKSKSEIIMAIQDLGLSFKSE